MADNFTTSAENELACPVCFLYYVPPYDPKNLPNCSHICCSLCLKDMTARQKKLKCPTCNKESKIPSEGVDGLPTILAMRNLAMRHPEGIKQQKEHMENDLRRQKGNKEKILKEVTEHKKKVRDSVQHEISEIEKSAEAVKKQAQELIDQIKTSCQPDLTRLQEKVLKVAGELKNIDNTCTQIQKMSDEDFLAKTDALTQQIAKLNIQKPAPRSSQCYQVGKFIANDVKLGRIVRPRRLELVRDLQVDVFGRARNIAAMPNGLLVVCDNATNPREHRPQQVIVLENKSGQYGMQVQFSVVSSEIYKQIDVAVSADCHYLITKCTDGIEMYSAEGKYMETIKTHKDSRDSKSDTITTCVATTADGRILAGSGTDTGEKTRTWFITVHDPEGKLLKTMPIGMMPLHIANIRGTHVAISGSKTVQDKVCVYMFDLRTGTETLKIDIPIGLGIKFCFDEQSNCILIARCTVGGRRSCDGTCVVEQYCSITGKLVACLSEGLPVPFGMTLIHDGMLAVSYTDSVKLYKLT